MIKVSTKQYEIMKIFADSDLTTNLSDIARQVGVSREYVRQVVTKLTESAEYKKLKNAQAKERKKLDIENRLKDGLIKYKMVGDNLMIVNGRKYYRIMFRDLITDKFYNKSTNKYARILKTGNSVKLYDVKRCIDLVYNGRACNLRSELLHSVKPNENNCYAFEVPTRQRRQEIMSTLQSVT